MNYLHFAANIGVAFLMGIMIGIERQYGQHRAGVRTNTLVCVGSAIFVSLSHALVTNGDATRIAGQVVTGIGFLGGGVILREGFSVRGMNTAATLWCTAAVGTLAGAGLAVESFLATLAILTANLLLRPLAHWIDKQAKNSGMVETVYRFHVVCKEEQAALVRSICMRHINSQPELLVQGISTKELEGTTQAAVIVDIFATCRKDKFMNDLVERLNLEECVSSVSWEMVT